MRHKLLALCLAASTQAHAAAPLPPAALQADLAILQSALEQLHPGLYRYSTKPAMDARFAALRADFAHPQSLQQAFLSLSLFAAGIKCGHTYLNFLNQPAATAAALFDSEPALPVYFRWLGTRMVVTRDFTAQHLLPPGSEILTINATPVATILHTLLPIARADGSNDAKRVAYLGVDGHEKYEAFDVYFPMFFPWHGATLALRARQPGQATVRALNVAPLSHAQRLQARATTPPAGAKPEPLFTARSLPDGTAYFSMPTWALYDSAWQWRPWLSARLDEAAQRHAPALVLDLRGNEGGDDVGAAILPHLTTRPIAGTPYARLVRYQHIPPELNPFLSTWDSSFRDWGAQAVPLAQPWRTAPPVSYFALRDQPAQATAILPAATPFRGRVFVLIDGSNSSATFQFAKAVQANHLGTLVGEPTGGNQRGINGGAFFFLRLPNSGLELDLPLIGTFPATPQPDAGLLPDVAVVPSVDDIAAGRDVDLAVVARLVATHSRKESK